MQSTRERKRRERETKRAEPSPALTPNVLFRVFVVGAVAVVASGYGIYRYYFVPRPPMVVPTPVPTEIPAPSLEPAD